MTAMITKDGDYWEPTEQDLIAWQRAYPDIDVYQELNAAACWLDANESKRKTLRGMKRFCNAWLNRSQQKGGSPFVDQRPKADVMPTREMTMEQMMDRSWAL